MIPDSYLKIFVARLGVMLNLLLSYFVKHKRLRCQFFDFLKSDRHRIRFGNPNCRPPDSLKEWCWFLQFYFKKARQPGLGF